MGLNLPNERFGNYAVMMCDLLKQCLALYPSDYPQKQTLCLRGCLRQVASVKKNSLFEGRRPEPSPNTNLDLICIKKSRKPK